MTEYTQGESLRKHMLAVEAAVRGYARQFGEDEDDWGVVALLHDFDYERYPDQENHPFRGVEILKAKGYPEWVTRAILSHADYSGVPRESRLEKTLYACDEMSGFVTAASLVRPSKSIMDLEASSVIKRMKDKAFARAVNRDDLRRGAEELGLPLDQHITNVIAFMREQADDWVAGTLSRTPFDLGSGFAFRRKSPNSISTFPYKLPTGNGRSRTTR